MQHATHLFQHRLRDWTWNFGRAANEWSIELSSGAGEVGSALTHRTHRVAEMLFDAWALRSASDPGSEVSLGDIMLHYFLISSDERCQLTRRPVLSVLATDIFKAPDPASSTQHPPSSNTRSKKVIDMQDPPPTRLAHGCCQKIVAQPCARTSFRHCLFTDGVTTEA